MYLIFGGRELEVPVLPPKLTVQSPGANETATVLELGQINILRRPGLRSIRWESFLPARSGPYVTGRLADPAAWIRAVQSARDSRQEGRFLITGTDLDVNMAVAVESLDYEERGGEPGDIYYTITLKEWRQYGAARVLVGNAGSLAKSKPKRSGAPAPAKGYTVKAGDSLWAIAQQVYGDGSRYPELYSKNKDAIDKGNKGTGNPQYTIYPGQEFWV